MTLISVLKVQHAPCPTDIMFLLFLNGKVIYDFYHSRHFGAPRRKDLQLATKRKWPLLSLPCNRLLRVLPFMTSTGTPLLGADSKGIWLFSPLRSKT